MALASPPWSHLSLLWGLYPLQGQERGLEAGMASEPATCALGHKGPQPGLNCPRRSSPRLWQQRFCPCVAVSLVTPWRKGLSGAAPVSE